MAVLRRSPASPMAVPCPAPTDGAECLPGTSKADCSLRGRHSQDAFPILMAVQGSPRDGAGPAFLVQQQRGGWLTCDPSACTPGCGRGGCGWDHPPSLLGLGYRTPSASSQKSIEKILQEEAQVLGDTLRSGVVSVRFGGGFPVPLGSPPTQSSRLPSSDWGSTPPPQSVLFS